jgi:hypothetical protein
VDDELISVPSVVREVDGLSDEMDVWHRFSFRCGTTMRA